MQKTVIAFSQVPQLAQTDVAYSGGEEKLRHFYSWEPSLETFSEILKSQEKRQFPRETLVKALEKQYASLANHVAVLDNIRFLGAENGFSVVTAHQPSLFLGPLYFVYKAITTIKLAREIQEKIAPEKHIVPVFVMGSEDHDLEELNHINLFGKRLVWAPETGGAVGDIPAETLKTVLAELRDILGTSEAAQELFAGVEAAYSNKNNFAQATQALLHHFLGRFGLVVLNMNEPTFKRLFIPVMRAELLEQPAFRLVNETIGKLQTLGYKAQAAPREINLFYLQAGSRERIVLENGTYQVLNTDLRFTEAEILAELETHPEKFSPNVVLRPLFQELILPNLAYVGGGGELAYWLERRSLFEHFNLSFPMLLRRNSLLFIDKDSGKKLAKLSISVNDFFADTEWLIRKFIESNAAAEINLGAEMRETAAIFDKIAQKATQIDPTLEKAVRAEETKAVAAVEQWQSRLVRAEKQKHEVSISQIRTLKEKYFPGNGLQERHDNILGYLLKYGPDFLDILLEQMHPFDPGFIVLSEAFASV